MAPSKVVLASPRGYCAGVDRAVDTVERALDHFGPPVYVRREIVHNRHVVSELTGRGAVFVETEEDVPPGAVLVLSPEERQYKERLFLKPRNPDDERWTGIRPDISDSLRRATGNVAEAARALQTDRANLYRRMKRLGL